MKIFSVLKRIKNGQLPGFTYMFKKICKYCRINSEIYGISKVYLFVNYFWCALIYGCSGDNYFSHKFFWLNRHGKKRLMTNAYQHGFEKKHTDLAQKGILDDKEKCLYHFRDFIGRDWCGCKLNNSEEAYNQFYEKHERAIIKPLSGLGGRGIEIINVAEKFSSSEEMRKYCMSGNLLVEELICQHEELNKVYPNAINTLRMITLKGKCIGAALRMGVGESKVDNASSGGIYSEVDLEEGVILGKALQDVNNKTYVCHPTTGTVLPGVKIPYWSECKALVEEASKFVTGLYLVGWDVAVTPDGPTIVEANTNPGLGLVQAPNNHGLKHEFEKIKD